MCVLQSVILLKTNFITNKNIKNQEDLKPYMDEISGLQKSLESLPAHERMSGKNVYKQNELLISKIILPIRIVFFEKITGEKSIRPSR